MNAREAEQTLPMPANPSADAWNSGLHQAPSSVSLPTRSSRGEEGSLMQPCLEFARWKRSLIRVAGCIWIDRVKAKLGRCGEILECNQARVGGA